MKKRILTIALAVALLATCFGGTLAYLKDTDTVLNTFTSGTVYITLDEAAVTKNAATGNLDANGTERVEAVSGQVVGQNYHLYPAMTVTKDPTITVTKGSEPAYVAAKVTITGDLHSLIGIDGTDRININAVASGGLLDKTPAPKDNWNNLDFVHETEDCFIYQQADKANNTWTLYIFMKQAQDAKDEAVKTVLFTTLTIPAEWDNEKMTKVNGMKINVQAFAAQTNGFADCFAAMTTAFKDDFKFN